MRTLNEFWPENQFFFNYVMICDCDICECTFCCFELFFYAGFNSVLVLARTHFQKRFFLFLLPQCDFSWLNKGWIKISCQDKKRPLWNIYCAQLHTNKSWFFFFWGGHWKRFKTQDVMWKSISTPAGQRKVSHFSKTVATELAPRGITCRAQQLAIHQMPEPPGSEKYGFMSEIKRCLVCVARRKSRQREAPPLCPHLTHRRPAILGTSLDVSSYFPHFLLNSPSQTI